MMVGLSAKMAGVAAEAVCMAAGQDGRLVGLRVARQRLLVGFWQRVLPFEMGRRRHGVLTQAVENFTSQSLVSPLLQLVSR